MTQTDLFMWFKKLIDNCPCRGESSDNFHYWTLILPSLHALEFCFSILSESTGRVGYTIGKTSVWQLESPLRGKEQSMEKNTSGSPSPRIPIREPLKGKSFLPAPQTTPFPHGSICLSENSKITSGPQFSIGPQIQKALK